MTNRKDAGEARAIARSIGAKSYEGKPCLKHPTNSSRWVINGCCVECTKAGVKPYRERNAAKLSIKRKEWDSLNPIKSMLQRARRRAKETGLKFDLNPEDIELPNICPVLGIPLTRHASSKDSAPSLDRIDNDQGYVRGNIVVVSFRANRIKGNSTFDELRKVVKFYEQYHSENN